MEKKRYKKPSMRVVALTQNYHRLLQASNVSNTDGLWWGSPEEDR